MSEESSAENSFDIITFHIRKQGFSEYNAYLQDKHRPPSKGGNTRAWHSHVLKIDGETYSFFALGQKKWAFVGDLVSFEWTWNSSKRYRNIDSKTFRAWAKDGNPVVRGIRGTKPWRTATTRLPVSRVEQRVRAEDLIPIFGKDSLPSPIASVEAVAELDEAPISTIHEDSAKTD